MITPTLPSSLDASPRPERRRSTPTARVRLLRWGCLAGALLLATSCGSSASDGASSDSASSDSASSDTTAAASSEEPESASSDDESSPSGSGTGTIEIAGERHDLTITRCFAMAGAIGGDGVSTSEPDNVQFTFEFAPEDWADRTSEGWTENGTVRLDSDDPYLQWESGESLLELYNLPDGAEPSSFVVTSYDIADDGQSVSGEAVFLELTALMTGEGAEPLPGTFAFSCPPEG